MPISETSAAGSFPITGMQSMTDIPKVVMAEDEWVLVEDKRPDAAHSITLPIRSAVMKDIPSGHPDVEMEETDDDASDEDAENNEDQDGMFDMFTGEVIKEDDKIELAPDSFDETASLEDDRVAELDSKIPTIDHETDLLQSYDHITPNELSQMDSEASPDGQSEEDIRTLNAQAHLPFVYKPLNDRSHLRVVEILPADTPNERLQLSMKTTLPTRAYYLALSYTWGQTYMDGSHLTETVPCDGKLLKITSRLYSILVRMREHLDAGHWTMFDRRPYVWVDAICIDQESVQDKNSQVKLMAKIYGKAAIMIAWLGEAEQDYTDRLQQSIDVLDRKSYKDFKSTAYIKELSFTKADMIKLLERDWFKRRWVIQELAARKTRTLVIGNAAIQCSSFFNLVQYYDLVNAAGAMRDLVQLDSFRPRRWLLTNLHRYREAQCSILHDIVYSLVHISCACRSANASSHCGSYDCHGINSSIDYSLSYNHLLRTLAHDFLQHDMMATLASACTRVSYQRNPPTFSQVPSWIPDWSISPRNGSPRLLKYIDRCFESPISNIDGETFVMFDERGRWESKCQKDSYVSPRESDPNSIVMRGWIMERPGKTTRVSSLDWSQVGGLKPNMRFFEKDYHVEQKGPWVDRPVSTRHLYVQKDSQGPAYEVVSGDWPVLDADDFVCFLFGYQLAFIIRPVKNSTFKLVGCLRRPRYMGKTSFVWTHNETGEVWAYGSLRRPPLIFTVT